MHQRIPVSQARARLSHLLKHLQAHPDAVFEITVNGLVLGELHAPEAAQLKVKPGRALHDALKVMGPPEIPAPKDRAVAREHDRYLYPSPPGKRQKR